MFQKQILFFFLLLTGSFSAQYQATWQNLINIDVQPNYIRKSAGWNWNNGGALSRNVLRANTDGAMTYVIRGTESLMMVGLSEYNNIGHYSSINYAMYYNYGTLKVWENGANKGAFGSLATGDTLIIKRISDSIKYFKHGIDGSQQLLRSRITDPTKELYVDLSIYYPNLYINHVNCTFQEEATILLNNLVNENITNGTLGSIDITPLGVSPFTYNWSNGATTEDISGLQAGDYTLTLIDGSSDTVIKTFTVEPEEIFQVNWYKIQGYDLITSSNKLDKSSSNGWNTQAYSTNILKTNKNGKFSYVISGEEQISVVGLRELLNDVPSIVNNYRFYIVNINNSNYIRAYSGNSAIGVNYQTSIGDTLILKKYGNEITWNVHKIDGTSDVIASKIINPSIELSVTVRSNDASAIVNNVHCSFDDGLTIEQNTLYNQNTTNNTLGSINVNTTGDAPLTYSWSNGATTEDISGLQAGTYTLTVTDNTGATLSKSFEIITEASYQVNWHNIQGYDLITATNKLDKSSSNGWNAGALSTNKLDANIDGKISYVITGEEESTMIGFAQYNNLTPYSSLKYKFYIVNSGNSNYIAIYNGNALQAYDFTINFGDTIILERKGTQMIWKNHSTDGSQNIILNKTIDPSEELYIDLASYAASAIVNNVHCSFDDGLTIEQNTLYNQNTTNNTLGSINVNTTGDAPLTYSWSNGATTEDISGLQAGTYTLTVTDNTGATLSKSFEIITEASYQVNWHNIQGYDLITATNKLDKSSSNGWNAGALSTNKLDANIDGKISYVITGEEESTMIGFAQYNNLTPYSSLKYKFYIVNSGNSNYIAIYNGNALQAYDFTINFGDTIILERKGTQMIWKNHSTDGSQNIILNKTIDPSEELYIDLASYAASAIVNNTYATFGVKNSKCNIGISTDNVKAICPGDFVELTVHTGVNNTYGYYDFIWSPNNTVSSTPISTDTNSLTFLANPTTTINYTLQYSFYTTNNLLICSGRTNHSISVKPDCDPEDPSQEIIGCCFGNFGAGVYIGEQTNLNVYCNLLNELGSNEDGIKKGEFINRGNINVKLDWIHNAQNNLYITNEGGTNLIGADQQMRGTSSTHYYNLSLKGNNTTKEILIAEHAVNNLQLNNNELAATDHTFYVENSSINAITNTNGYISTDGVGRISRNIDNNSTTYIYPMGSQNGTVRYRPLEITTGNSSAGAFDVNFQNSQIPALLNTTSKAPNVQSLNTDYYYKFNTTSTATDLKIETYYPVSEGPYQSLSQWRLPTTGDRWEMSPGANANNTPSNNSNTLGLLSASSEGIQNYTTENFTLSRAGFTVNIDSLNGGSEGTTVITITNPNDPDGDGVDNSTGGSTPSGGGLDNPSYADNDDVFVPSPVAGTYNINIETNDYCSENGTVQFTINNTGIIDESNILYFPGDTTASFYLAEELFEIDNIASGFSLNAEPNGLLSSCVNEVSVKMGTSEPFVLNMAIGSPNSITEDIIINYPAILTFGSFKILKSNSSQTVIYSIQNNALTLNPASWIEEGAYSFELSFLNTTEIIKGQFIIK